MKKIITAFAFLSISFIAQAQNAPAAQAVQKPVAAAEDNLGMKELEYDFGRIPQGKPVTHIFTVENTGKDSLTISNVQASCGCTTPEWERNKALAPGEKTKITVGYNAAAEGPFTKYITILYNGTLNKQVTIKGEVWKTPATSAPENKDLKALSED
ncbi:MAG TPA: DUF1573 domain-containing protein [Ferruginibacter sp.]|nr:DUF1573 domain-containing protein [Ferruginibacter sp.]HPH93131.1 DUF1573 domain-containing protein [Ferruginibacter sp.]